MKKSLIFAFLASAALAFPHILTKANDNDNCMCIASEKVKKYCEAENAGIQKNEYKINQEAIAKRDIQRLIDHSVSADIAKDAKARSFIETKDLTIKTLEGETFSGADTKKIGAATNNYQGILLITSDTRIVAECVTLKGKDAIVYTNQHFVRYVPDRKDESPHEVITNIIHREIWTFTEQGWRVKYIEELERGNTYLDGKLYNPG